MTKHFGLGHYILSFGVNKLFKNLSELCESVPWNTVSVCVSLLHGIHVTQNARNEHTVPGVKQGETICN